MKNFNFNLLQYLNNKKAEKGFTLIELLVVIIIIGILSAIALPAFLNQANKARQSEAKQALGAINRGQQAYYLERQLFSENINGLGLGVNTATENYSYGDKNDATLTVGNTEGADAGTRNTVTGWTSYAVAYAVSSNQDAVRDYLGMAYVVGATATEEATTQAALCEETDLAGSTISPNTTAGSYGCGTGSLPVAQ